MKKSGDINFAFLCGKRGDIIEILRDECNVIDGYQNFQEIVIETGESNIEDFLDELQSSNASFDYRFYLKSETPYQEVVFAGGKIEEQF